jgi:hypothetical protein
MPSYSYLVVLDRTIFYAIFLFVFAGAQNTLFIAWRPFGIWWQWRGRGRGRS